MSTDGKTLDDSDARAMLARAARSAVTGDTAEAERLARRVLEAAPLHADALHFLGALAAKTGDYAAAERDLRASLAIKPDVAEAHLNLGTALHNAGKLDEAIAAMRRAIALRPGFAEAHFNLATSLLLRAEFAEGWREHEWRWRASNFTTRRRHGARPSWAGEPLGESALLLWGEQGVGDEILHAGLIEQAAASARHCILESDRRLVPLFRRSFPALDVAPRVNPPHERTQSSDIAWQCPTGSLPRFFRARAEDFRPRPDYLVADEAAVAGLRGRYRAFGPRPLIGIAWRSKNPKLGVVKSVPLIGWAPILTTPGVTFVDLQYGDCAAELAEVERTLSVRVHHDDAIDQLADLDGFAAQIAALDLVISIDNTTVHMAGALGKPTWVLLPRGPGLVWFWFLERADSPWYPSLRLFRQPTPGAWAPAIERVAAELTAWCRARR